MTTSCAPIALFAFNRPQHLESTLMALGKNDLASGTEVTIFCDGPRADEDREAVSAVRQVAHAATGFRNVNVVERPENFGLARSVITGVDEILRRHETVIVVEDDLITTPFFLSYMNDGLQTFAANEKVISICAYTHPTSADLPETFFLPGAHCWGWATWRRGWALFEHDAHTVLEALDKRDLIYDFDVNGAAPYTLMVHRVASGEGDSWALRWMASAILNEKVSLYPGNSLVQNIGNEGSGTNAGNQDVFETSLAQSQPKITAAEIEIDALAFGEYRNFMLRGFWRGGLINRFYSKLLKLLSEPLRRRLYTAVTRKALRAARKKQN